VSLGFLCQKKASNSLGWISSVSLGVKRGEQENGIPEKKQGGNKRENLSTKMERGLRETGIQSEDGEGEGKEGKRWSVLIKILVKFCNCSLVGRPRRQK